MNNILFVLFGIIILSSIINSCECVPDINTPKEITPSDYSLSMFINATSKYDKLMIESDEVVVNENLTNSETELKYIKVWSGNRYLRVIENQNTILNLPVSFKKQDYYTVVFYNFGSKLKSMIVKDSILQLSPINFSNYRIITAIENNIPLNIEIFKDGTAIIAFYGLYNSISDYNSINTGNYKIRISNPTTQSIITETEFNFSINSICNILIKGNINSQQSPISISVFKTELSAQ